MESIVGDGDEASDRGKGGGDDCCLERGLIDGKGWVVGRR